MTISFNNGSSSSSCHCSGIKGLVINNSGHLVVTYDDGLIQDLGLVVGANGTNFYPNEMGFNVPGSDFDLDKPQGWTYLSLVQPVTLYFKTNAANEPTSTWVSAPFGQGQIGQTGKPFGIDSKGSVLPTMNLTDGYTFYNTTDGKIYIYDLDTQSWKDYQFRGEQGLQGQFIINSQGIDFPEIANLTPGYTFYSTDTGFLYYVIVDSNGQKSWSQGILFRGKEGDKGDKGDQGDPGKDANNIFAIKNSIDNSFENALLVIGKVPAGYLVTRIEVTIIGAYDYPVTELAVRFGGTAQSELDGTIIAPVDYFDINAARKYIVDEINHDVSDKEEILSCIFNESVNNSAVGSMTIVCTVAKQLEITPIEDHI